MSLRVIVFVHSRQVTFTVDIRAMDDLGREAIIYEFSNRIHEICDKRSVLCLVERKVRFFAPPIFIILVCLEAILLLIWSFGNFQHDADAVACDAELSSKLRSAAYAAVGPLSDESFDMPVLMSGAGHDAMAMSHLTKVLLFCSTI